MYLEELVCPYLRGIDVSDLILSFGNSGCRCGLLDLPEELLLDILRRLRLPALVSIRLVCSLLRKLSCSLIKTLSANSYNLGNCAEAPNVAEQLQALPNVTNLRFEGDPSSCAAFLGIPGCAPKLRELDVQLSERGRPGMDVLLDFGCKLKSATGLTSLVWSRYSLGDVVSDPVLCLAAICCPQLVHLEMLWLTKVPHTGINFLLQLTALQKLRFGRHAGRQLFPHLACFPVLNDVGTVFLEEQDANGAEARRYPVKSIAALTALTRVEGECMFRFAPLEPLARLPSLRALTLSFNHLSSGDFGGKVQIRGITQLTELAVIGKSLSMTGLGHVLGPLPSLETLHLHCQPCPIGMLLEIPLRRLRHLSIALGAASPSEFLLLCSALAGLERLSVSMSSAAAVCLVPHLSLLTRLTALRIEARPEPGEAGYPTGARAAASFLTGLTGLVDLKLSHVLSPDNALSDIPCLATLTGLRWLVMESGVWGLPWHKASDPLPDAAVEETPEQPPHMPGHVNHVSIKPEDLLPLAALRMLHACDLFDSWRCEGDNPEFVVERLCGLREFSRQCSFSKKRCWKGSAFKNLIESPR